MQPIEITIENIQKKTNIKLIKLIGELDIVGSNELIKKITPILESSRLNFILDLSKLSYINSTGIFTLVHIFTKMKETGKYLKFISINKSIKDVLDALGIFNIIPTFNNLEDALNDS